MGELYQFLAVIGILLLLGIFSSKLSARFNVPILLMFLLVGMLAGPDGLTRLDFANNANANVLGILAMSFILFSGGLDTSYKAVKSVIGIGGFLATAGVMLTALILGGCAWLLLPPPLPGWDLKWWLLLASVVSSTDAAAVFAILRSKSVSLKGKLQPLLEFESGSNDPMAAFLTIFMIGIITGEGGFAALLPQLVVKMAVGVGWGYVVGRLGCWLFNKVKLDYEGLYFVMGIALVLISYGIAECIYGNGFMAVYISGMTMGNFRFNFKKGLLRFHDGIAWLMQVALFVTLGLLVRPSQLPQVAGTGFALAALLMLVARPAAVLLGMSRPVTMLPGLGKCIFTFREQLLISWVGLRGAAPIVLATFPMMTLGVTPFTGMLFNLVFFMVLMSVLIQGRTLMPFARLLKLDRPLSDKERVPLELEETGAINGRMHEFEVQPGSMMVGRTLAELRLPPGVLVMLIRRGRHFVLARGNTRIEERDGMLMMGDPDSLVKVAVDYFGDEEYDPED